MYQIDNSTASPAQPASTPAGSAGFFTDGNPASGTAATIMPAEWLNSVMMELVNVVIAGGLTPTKNVFDQVAKAIKAIGKQRVILNDAGAANAYTATNSPALLVGTWVDGIAQSVKISNANTGASTYSPDGLAAIPIYGLGLQPLQGGELRAGGVATMVRFTIAGVNSGNPICVLLDCFGGAQQVAPATQSNHAVTLGQVSALQLGRLLNVRRITANGTYTPTVGTNAIVVFVQGGGGAGGSTSTTGASQTSVAGGGGAGGCGASYLTSGFSGVSMTVGAGSVGGGAGATASSFGAFITASPGLNATNAPASSSAATVLSIQGIGGACAGGNLFNAKGQDGYAGVAGQQTSFISGSGAPSYFGGGGVAQSTTTSVGAGAQSNGSGGGGALAGASIGPQVGGSGGAGLIVIYEYAYGGNMKNYARIDAGRVAEVVLGLAYEIDAPAFVPQPIYDEAGDLIGETTAPADWPRFAQGDEVPIEKRFVPEFVAALVEIPEGVEVQSGYTYVDKVFAPYVAPPPSAAEILARNTTARNALLALAAQAIAPLEDAADLDMATPQETAALIAWKTFRVQANRVDLTQASPTWPAMPA